MLQRGVVTRSGAALGMPGRLRITIGTPDDNAVLVAALESLVAAAV
jgi:histidinol-phosphate aminotransferase